MSTLNQKRSGPGLGGRLRSKGRLRDGVELAATYALVVAGCWTARPAQRILFWIAIAWIAAILALRREDWKSLDAGWRGALASLWLVAAALVLGAAAIAAAARLGTLHDLALSHQVLRSLWPRAGGYLIWAVLQQIVLQDVVLLRLLRLTGSRGWAVAIAAALFAGAHVPNPLLIVLTAVWGVAACLLFLRYRSVFSVGVAHAILGLAIALSIPNHVDRHMRVGRGYLTYRPRSRERSRAAPAPLDHAAFPPEPAHARLNGERATRAYRPRHG